MKKIISVVCVLAFAVVALVGCFGFLNTEPDSKYEEITQTNSLSAPQQVSFDKDTYTLSWSSVENAAAYQISYNDAITEVEATQTSKQFMLTAQVNRFKVKAISDNYSYYDSEWSNEITYTLEQATELSVFDKVNLALNQTAQKNNLELVKVIGISYVNVAGSGAGTNLRFETICLKNDVEKNVQLDYAFSNYNNIFDMINNIENYSKSFVSEKSIVKYNSAAKLVKSGSYAGQMQKLADQGYTISVVDSCVREGKKIGTKFKFEIVGTYKATRGDGVKYFTSINKIEMKQVSTKESTNYEQSVIMEDMRTVTETTFVLHEASTTLAYIEKLATSLGLD